jgi:hypothetical protein
MTDQPSEQPKGILPYVPPANAIIISQEQFEELEERAQRKPTNPMPYAILALFLVLVAVVGSMSLGIYLTRPTPIVWPTAIPIEKVIIPPTVTETRTPTATITPTPDMTQTVEASPVWSVVFHFFERLQMADYGSAWHMLTERCRDIVCWDNFHSDYKLFIETMRRYGVISIQELRPELVYNNTASAFVTLFFKKEMQPHSYRFFLLYDGDEWKIDSVEFISLVK